MNSAQFERAKQNLGTRQDPVANFGRRVSSRILAKLDQVPPPNRPRFLKRALDQINPRLWPRVDTRAKRLKAKKGYSAKEALRRAMAAELSNQFLSEMIETGKRGSVRRTGVLALGAAAGRCRPARGLGSIQDMLAIHQLDTVAREPTEEKKVVKCGPDQRERHVWDAELQAWKKVCVTGEGVTAGEEVTVMGEEGAETTGGRPEPDMEVAGFMFYSTPKRATRAPVAYHRRGDKSTLPDRWKRIFRQEEGRIANILPGKGRAADYGLDYWLGMSPDRKVSKEVFEGKKPIVKFKHPIHGGKWGVYLVATKDSFSAWAKPRPKSWYEKLWNAIKDVAAKIVEVAKEVVKEVADATCDVLQDPLGQVGVAAGAAAAGAPPQAGMAGAQVGATVCKGPPPGPSFPGAAADGLPGWLLPVAIVGGLGVVAYFVLK